MALKWIVVLGTVLFAAQVSAGETPPLKTQTEKQSYGMGVDMGRNLKRQGAEVNPDLLLKGLKDALGGQQLLLSDEELMVAVKSFAAERRLKQQKDKSVPTQESFKVADMETLYALGLVVYRQLADFDLSAAELELVKQGLTDAGSGKGPDGEVAAYSEKINELARTRRKALGQRLAKESKGFLEKAAQEKGARRSESGLVFLSLKDGSGASPKATDTVKVNYRGTFIDGKEFANTYLRKEPIELKMDGAITCWKEGLQKMKAGGKAKLCCPSELAYGESGAGSLILPYATLVFEVELLDVAK